MFISLTRIMTNIGNSPEMLISHYSNINKVNAYKYFRGVNQLGRYGGKNLKGRPCQIRRPLKSLPEEEFPTKFENYSKISNKNRNFLCYRMNFLH